MFQVDVSRSARLCGDIRRNRVLRRKSTTGDQSYPEAIENAQNQPRTLPIFAVNAVYTLAHQIGSPTTPGRTARTQAFVRIAR
jgi:hypothetical protein